MLEFLSDLFFERVQQAILWKPRGGGGSLAAAILIWLMMVYRNKSFIDMAGSGEQAKRVYEYTTQFWYCVPGLAEGGAGERSAAISDAAQERRDVVVCPC